MSELTGKQIETLRIGLQFVFGEPRKLTRFLREKLNKVYVNYVGERDKFPEACFNIVTSSEEEDWRDDLIREAHKERPENPNIARVGRELGLIAVQDAGEHWLQGDAAAADAEPPLWRTFNPYRGMLALREQDANYLFGRDEDIDRFINAVELEPSKILLALGASGVGKSSLIFAGVLGALRRRSRKSRKPWPVALEDSHKWPHLVLTPEAEPLYNLAGAFVRQWIDETEPDFRKETNEWRALLADGDSLDGLVKAADAAWRQKQEDPPPRYLIYVDQGEELYTRGRREPGLDHTDKEKPEQKEARRFSELLSEAAAHPRLIVLMSARSDFLGQLQADKRLSDGHPAKIFDVHRQLNINPLGEDGLEQVITRPAEMLGVSFENGLDKALAKATREEIGGIPLLSYTLETLWQEMQVRDEASPILCWSGPAGEAIDIAKKLAEHADAFVRRHKHQEPILQRLFCVRLAHVPVQGDPTRQRTFLDELSSEENDLVKELADREQRIVVTGESEGRAIAEVAHEKLFTSWGRLQTWLASRREFYIWATQIEAWRKEWEKAGRRPGDLLIGRPLEHAKAYLETSKADIGAGDAAFIRESTSSYAFGKAIKQALIGGAFLMIALIAVIAIFQWRVAESERDVALIAQSRLLVGRAEEYAQQKDFGSAILLALEGLSDGNELQEEGDLSSRPYVPEVENSLSKAYLRLLERSVLMGHAGAVTSAMFSPDGSLILTASEDMTARLWSAEGRAIATLTGHEKAVTSAMFSPDGSRILSISDDSTARLWNTEGKLIATLIGHEKAVTSAMFSPKGSRILTVSDDRTTRLWSAEGQPIVTLTGFITSAVFSPDGEQVLTASALGTAQLWTVEGKVIAAMDHEGRVHSAVFSPDGTRILTVSNEETTVQLWSAEGKSIATLTDVENFVTSAVFSPDGSRILINYLFNRAQLWSVKDQRVNVLEDQSRSVFRVVFSPDGQQFLTAHWNDKSARLWSTEGKLVAMLTGHEDTIDSAVFSLEGEQILTISGRSFSLWNAKGEQVATLAGHSQVNSAAFSPDGSRILTVSVDGTARLWSAESRSIATLTGHESTVTSAVFSPDGSRILTASEDATARLWSAEGDPIVTLTGHESAVTSAVFSPDGSRILTASNDMTARLWSAEGQPIVTLTGHESTVTSAVFSPDGSRILTASKDMTARLWNMNGKIVSTLKGHQQLLYKAVFSPDGSRILTSSDDRTARLWSAQGQSIKRLDHNFWVNIAMFSPDGERILTAAGDGIVRLWNARGMNIASLTGRKITVTSALFAPDGERILTSSQDGTARHWTVPKTKASLVELAKITVPRCLTPWQRQNAYLPPKPPRWCYKMKKWPYDPATLFKVGKQLLKDGKPDEARAKFAEAREHYPSLGPEIDTSLAAVEQNLEVKR